MRLPALHLDWVSVAVGFLAGLAVFRVVQWRRLGSMRQERAYDMSSFATAASSLPDEDTMAGERVLTPRKSHGGSRLGWHTLFALLLPVLIIGGIVLGIRAFITAASSSTMGTVQATGPEMGSWTMQVDKCRSGQLREFHGVQLFSKEDSRLAVFMIEDPVRGLVASINSTSGNYAVNFDKGSCFTMHGSANFNGTIFNNIRELDGSYDFDCVTDTAHVTGHVAFKRCH